MQFPSQYPVQGQKATEEEVERARFRRWLDLKRLKDAERSAREGMKGYR